MKEYVECDVCNSKIYFGDTFYEYDGRCGIYCSPKCFCAAVSSCKVLTMDAEQAEDHCCVVMEEH